LTNEWNEFRLQDVQHISFHSSAETSWLYLQVQVTDHRQYEKTMWKWTTASYWL